MKKIFFIIPLVLFSVTSYAQLSYQDSMVVKNYYWKIHSYFPLDSDIWGNYGYTNMYSGAYLKLNPDSTFSFQEYRDYFAVGRPMPLYSGNYIIEEDKLKLNFTEYKLDSTAALDYVKYFKEEKESILNKMNSNNGTYFFKMAAYYIFLVLPNQEDLFTNAAFTQEGIPPLNYLANIITGGYPIFLKGIKR